MFFFSGITKTLCVTSIVLISFLQVFGRIPSADDRLITFRAMQSQKDMQANVPKKLPFEPSVIIYYKAPEKAVKPSAKPKAAVAAPPKAALKNSSVQLNQAASAIAPDNKNSSRQRTVAGANAAFDLKPVIILYRTYGSGNAAAEAVSMPAKAPTSIASVSPIGSTAKLTEAIRSHAATSAHPVCAQDCDPVEERSENVPDKAAEPPPKEKADDAEAGPAKKAGATGDHDALGTAAASVIVPEQSLKEATVGVETAAMPGVGPASVAALGADAESDPFEVVGMNNLATHLTLEGKFDEARALLDKAIAAEPTEARFHRNLSVLFEMQKKFDQALASARTAADLAPNEPSILEQLCALELSKGDPGRALDCFERFKVVKPTDGLMQMYYGAVLLKNGKVDEALAILEPAVKVTNPLPETLNALGVVYFIKGRVEDAAAVLKGAVELDPDEPQYRYNLAIAHFSQGNRASALSQYSLLKSASPDLANKLYQMLYDDQILSVDAVKSRKH